MRPTFRSVAYLAAVGGCLILAANPKNSLAFPDAGGASQQDIRSIAMPPGYADIADLTDAAPLVVKGRIKRVKLLQNDAGGRPGPGYVRALIVSSVTSLIRGEGGIAPQITYLADLPLDRKGKISKTKNGQILLFARPTARAGVVQLVSRNAQMPWQADREATARAIASELLQNDSPPRLTAVGGAYHIPGTVAGEGETQIFLNTSSGLPVSLTITRRTGQAAQWGVSLGELTDDTTGPPARDTLLWYRLACSLPAMLPEDSVRDLSGSDAESARADYAFIMQALGTCGRTL